MNNETLKIDADSVDQAITNLNMVIAGLGEENLSKKIDEIEEEFANSSGDTANALRTVTEQYHTVNQALVKLCMKAKNMLIVAKTLYLDVDNNIVSGIDGNMK